MISGLGSESTMIAYLWAMIGLATVNGSNREKLGAHGVDVIYLPIQPGSRLPLCVLT